MTAKLSYEAEAREILYDYKIGVYQSGGAPEAILALVDKARQTQAEECAKHVPVIASNRTILACDGPGCDWRASSDSSGHEQYAQHIAALGRK